MNAPSIERIADLQQLITDFARIQRVPPLGNTGRAENDVEHSYGLALTSWFLAKHIAPELDLARILQYALTHDLVELHAGDTFVFHNDKAIATKSARENTALEKLSKDWGDFPDMELFARLYKEKADEEAKFVYAVDKILPVIMVNLSERKAFWDKHKITLQMMIEEKVKIKESTYVSPYYERLIDWLSDPNYFYQPDASQQR